MAQDREPPEQLKLVVGDSVMAIEPDQDLEVDLQGKTRLKVLLSGRRTFPYAGLHFDYPASFSFSFVNEDEIQEWTLEGSDVVIIVLGMPTAELGHREFARATAANFEQFTSEEGSLTADNQSLPTTTLRTEIAGQTITQLIAEIGTQKGTRLIIIQDALKSDGSHSQEYGTFIKLLADSLQIESATLPTLEVPPQPTS
jgi:hypothetical protein